MNLKKKLYSKHKDWIRIAKSCGAGNFAEDLVQEMYIRALKYIAEGKDLTYKNDINTSYIYVLIRHMTINYLIKKKKITVIHIDDVQNIQTNKSLNIESKYNEINKKLDEMYWYDAKVYRLIESGISIKELSRQSKISYYSLYRTYNKVKNELKLLI